VRYLTVTEILELHRLVVDQSGGSHGVRDVGAVKSAVALPQQTFDGEDLYPSLAHKAAAIGYSLIQNHPFIDGNKRVGHAAIEVTLLLNGFEVVAGVDEQEQVILSVAGGTMNRDELTSWLDDHIQRVA
jgi:death-on-curing protein